MGEEEHLLTSEESVSCFSHYPSHVEGSQGTNTPTPAQPPALGHLKDSKVNTLHGHLHIQAYCCIIHTNGEMEGV